MMPEMLLAVANYAVVAWGRIHHHAQGQSAPFKAAPVPPWLVYSRTEAWGLGDGPTAIAVLR